MDLLVTDLIHSSRIGDEARSINTEHKVKVPPAELLVATSLSRQGLPSDAETVARIRRAMAVPVADRLKPLPGAIELLSGIHALGMRAILVHPDDPVPVSSRAHAVAPDLWVCADALKAMLAAS